MNKLKITMPRCLSVAAPLALGVLAASGAAAGKPAATPVAEDKFERAEIDPWTTRYRPIQFVIEKGVLVGQQLDPGHSGTIHKTFAPTGDMRFEFDAKFEGAKKFGAHVGDTEATKIAHFGHVANFNFDRQTVNLTDDIGGAMHLSVRNLPQPERMAATVGTRVKQAVETPVKDGKWHHYTFEFRGHVARVLIDGQQAATLTSKGFAHPTKNRISFSVHEGLVHFDNVLVTPL